MSRIAIPWHVAKLGSGVLSGSLNCLQTSCQAPFVGGTPNMRICLSVAAHGVYRIRVGGRPWGPFGREGIRRPCSTFSHTYRVGPLDHLLPV
jgi:hypothetical protein